MSGYGDHYKDVRQAEFISRWTEGVTIPEPTRENLAWNIARARAAEAEVRKIRDALRVLKAALNG